MVGRPQGKARRHPPHLRQAGLRQRSGEPPHPPPRFRRGRPGFPDPGRASGRGAHLHGLAQQPNLLRRAVRTVLDNLLFHEETLREQQGADPTAVINYRVDYDAKEGL